MRKAGIVLLLALFLTPLLAQEDDTINVAGSRTVIDVFQTLAENSEVEASINTTVTGTATGLNEFCAGSVDIAAASRPISVDEETACADNAVEFDEFLIGYDVMVLITHPDLSSVTCLTQGDLDTIFAPSAQGQVTDWSQTFVGEATGPLTIYLPPDDSAIYALFDQTVGGFGLRTDVITESDPATLVDAVSSTVGAVGVASLNAVDSVENVHVVELNNPELETCYAPTLETIEGRQYPAVDRLFLYVNRSSRSKTGLNDLLTYTFGDSGVQLVRENGFTVPSSDVEATNLAILNGEADVSGRQFSLDVTEFQIPDSVFGSVSLGGAANLISYIKTATSQFNADYAGVTPTLTITGEPAGLRQLCNDQISIMLALGSMPDEAAANCEANSISTYEIDLGSQAVILLANSQDSYLECLTKEQILTIWGEPSTDTITIWNQVSDNFPEVQMSLVAPIQGTDYIDALLRRAEGAPLPVRLDTAEQNADALYRAAAVANVPGALTFMSWPEYQNVLDNGQGNIQLVGVDDGNGCVVPSESTIRDSSYPYAIDNKLIINRSDLSRPEVQSLVWYMFSDENFNLIDNAGLVGLEFGDLPTIREGLQTVFNEVLAEQSVPQEVQDSGVLPPEITPEATSEATPEATSENTGG